MTFMAFLLLLVLTGVFFLHFWTMNPQDLTIHLFGHDFSYPVAFFIFGCILLGLVLGYGGHIYSAVSHKLKHWREDRDDKRAKEVGSIYREGVTRLLSGDLKKAHALLQKAHDRDPKRVEIHIALANLRQHEGDPQAAISTLLKARDLDRSSLEVLFQLAASYETTDDLDQARETYQEILALDANNRKALRSLRDLAMKRESWEEAVDLQKKVLKVAAGSKRIEDEKQKLAHFRFEVARQSLENGKAEAAVAPLHEIAKETPGFVPARVILGDALVALGRTDEAIKIWQDGYRDLSRSVFLSRLEDYYMELEDPATLLTFYRNAINANQDDMVLRLFFGKFCLRLEMVDEAVEQLYAVESSGVESSQLHFLLAEAYRRRDRTEDAIEEYKRALGTNKHLRLGYICDSCGETYREWQGRCSACSTWGSLSLINRQLFVQARPLVVREIHHGER